MENNIFSTLRGRIQFFFFFFLIFELWKTLCFFWPGAGRGGVGQKFRRHCLELIIRARHQFLRQTLWLSQGLCVEAVSVLEQFILQESILVPGYCVFLKSQSPGSVNICLTHYCMTFSLASVSVKKKKKKKEIPLDQIQTNFGQPQPCNFESVLKLQKAKIIMMIAMFFESP